MPLVSICIPTYNGASYLETCLDSALAQTFPDFEVLIVDDQSTDNSFQIAQDYSARDPRIKVVQNRQNLGLVRNWNQCVLLARGEWIKYLFQDDLLEPNCIEKMLAVCGQDTSIVACKRNIIFEDDSEDLNETFIQYIKRYDMDKILPGEMVIPSEKICAAVLNNLGGNFIGEPTAILIRRNVFERFGFFNFNLISLCDFEYWIRVSTNTGLIYIPEILVHFRRHRKGATFVDEQSRHFRMYIDKLVCLHEFLFHPLYAQLRFYASQCQPPINLNQLFAGKVEDSWKIARQAAKNHSNPDLSLLDQMSKITALFPACRIVKKIPGSVRFGKYRWKLQNFISNRLNIKK
ncbi:MAG TPA: glycosyltransferase family 2 protein [Ignavibacteriaceae bacterium]|nr:glycosyltransferase family 2 protein [Ignavibacteriaceae bacterium]